MNASRMLLLADLFMGLSFLVCFITGLLKFPLFLGITGLRALGHNQVVTGLHEYSGILLGLLVVIHLILNRRWIATSVKGVFSKEKATP